MAVWPVYGGNGLWLCRNLVVGIRLQQPVTAQPFLDAGEKLVEQIEFAAIERPTATLVSQNEFVSDEGIISVVPVLPNVFG